MTGRTKAPSTEDVREARKVEIALAFMLGVGVLGLPTVGLALLRQSANLDGPGWDTASTVVPIVFLVLGALVTIGWLLRARRRGL